MNGSALGSAAYLVAVVSSLAAAGTALSRWTRGDALERALVGSVAALSVSSGCALVLGMVGALSAGIFLAVVVAVGVAATAVLVRAERSPRRVPAAWSIAGLGALLAGSAMAWLAFVPVLRALPSGHADTRNYHIANLVHWYRTHAIWGLPFQNPGFFTATHPGNGELAGIALLFATQGDHLIYAMNIFFGLLTVLACALLTRSLDGRPDLGALACLAVLGTPLVFGTQAHGLASDLPAVAGLVAGMAALFRAHEEHDPRWVAVAGFALGFALGAKYTVLLLVPLVIVAAVVVLRPRRVVLWLAPGLALLGGPWFVRNLVATGNPIFPQGITIGGVEVLAEGRSPLVAISTTMFDHVVAGRFGIVRRWLGLVWDFWGPAIGLAVVAVAFALLRRSDRLGRAARLGRLGVAAFVVVAGAVYLVTPYTGAGPQGLRFLIGSNLRYTMAVGVVGAALAAAVVPTRISMTLVAAAFAFDAWRMLDRYRFRTDLDLDPATVVITIAVAVAICAVVGVIGRRRPQPHPLVYAPLALAACLVAAVGIARIDDRMTVTPLERIIARADPREVTVIGATEVRSVLGRELDVTVTGVRGTGRAGERPLGARDLTAAVGSSGSDMLLVDDESAGVPDGWEPPPGWTRTATTEDGDVYVRAAEP